MSAYREPGVPSSTWWKYERNAIRLSQIRTVCFYQSNSANDHPCTVTFISGKNIVLTEAEGLALLRVLE